MSSNIPDHSKKSLSKQARIMQLLFYGQMASTESALFHQLAAAKNGMNITDSKAVSALMQEGPMTAGQLAQRLSLTTGAITSVIDRLQAAGYISRSHDPTDRRKIILRADGPNIAKASMLYETIGKSFANQLNGYTSDQLDFLISYYEFTISQTKAEIARLAD